MKGTKMNRQLGTKWFTFYTKVRPWISCLASVAIISDFSKYSDVYFSYWWLLLYFIVAIAQTVLAIIVFTKSEGNYGDFVRFVNGVLIFEMISIAYIQGVQQYLKTDEFVTSCVIALVILVIGYFLWYRLNIKYFIKRILTEESEEIICNVSTASRPPKNSNISKVNDTYVDHNICGDAIKLQKDDRTIHAMSQKAHFCRKCGTKLPEDALFCTNCGTKVVVDQTQ